MIKTGDIFMKDNIVERYNEIYEKLEANVRAFYPEGSQEHINMTTSHFAALIAFTGPIKISTELKL
jgi:hypothetical protein